jgi:hypothetical protein
MIPKHKKAEFLLRSHTNKFKKMVEKTIGTTELQNFTRKKKENKNMTRKTMFHRRQTIDGGATDFFFGKIGFNNRLNINFYFNDIGRLLVNNNLLSVC